MEWNEDEYLAFASDDKELLIRFETSDTLYIEFGSEYLEIPKERINDLINGLNKAVKKLERTEETEKDAQDAINDYYINGV